MRPGTHLSAETPATRRRLGALTATLLVVANMIGTGVFTTTGLLVAEIGSPLAVLLGWLIGGLLALCGALAYAELAAALPSSGGEFFFLGRIFSPAVGFVAGWISFVVGFSAPIAASALAFGHYLGAIAPGVDAAFAAVVLVLILSALHAMNVALGAGVQNLFALGKVGLILLFFVLAVFKGLPESLGNATGAPAGSALLSPAFAVGLIFIAFAYSGWNGAVYVAGEVRSPERSLPLALLAGTGIVVALYLGLNLVFLTSAPVDRLAGVVEVGHVAAVNLLGERAGSLLSGLIALALVSSVSAMVMAGPRVYEAIGKEHPVLSILGRRGARTGPYPAILIQAIAVVVMVVTASFATLLTYIGFTLSLSAGLTVLGVFVLRAREPALPRPYRTWGYPVTPILFLLLSAWMIVHALHERPVAGLAGLATVISGWLAYLLVSRLGNRTRA